MLTFENELFAGNMLTRQMRRGAVTQSKAREKELP
jgi:hypothetical protein